MTKREEWMLKDRWYNTDEEKEKLLRDLQQISDDFYDRRFAFLKVIQPLLDEITKLDEEAEDRIDPD